MNWNKAIDVNMDYKIPLSSDSNQTSVIVNVNFDFTEKIFTIEYVGILDIMQRIGGLYSSVWPIMRFLNPFLALAFLIALCKIIRENAKQLYQREVIIFLRLAEQ